MRHSVTGYTIVRALQKAAVLGENSEIFTDFWVGAFPACGTKKGFFAELDIRCFDIDAVGIAKPETGFTLR